MAEGRVNTGIIAVDPLDPEHDGLEQLDLLDDEVVIAVPKSHAWYRRDSIPQRSLLRTSVVMRDPEAHDRRCVERVLAERGLPMIPALVEVGSTAVAKREALERSAPVLISALSIDEGRDHLHVRPIDGLRFPRSFAIVCRSLASLSRGRTGVHRLPAPGSRPRRVLTARKPSPTRTGPLFGTFRGSGAGRAPIFEWRRHLATSRVRQTRPRHRKSS